MICRPLPFLFCIVCVLLIFPIRLLTVSIYSPIIIYHHFRKEMCDNVIVPDKDAKGIVLSKSKQKCPFANYYGPSSANFNF